MKKKIAFIKIGSFSHVNKFVKEILEREFNEYDLDIYEIEKVIIDPKSISAVLHTFKEYGPDIVFGNKEIKKYLQKTVFFFEKTKKELTPLLKNKDYVFTFQTQSVFDASVKGTPNFIYTDHTHLANLKYSEFKKQQLCSEEWLELEKSIYQNSALNLSTSEFAIQSMINDYGIEPQKNVCVYSGINIDDNYDRTKRKPFSKKILFVGMTWERKGGPLLEKAFYKILDKHPDAKLFVVGCNPKISHKNIEVIGRVPREEVASYYMNSDIFCMPSKVEPSAVALVEASLFELPVISTKVGGTVERVLENKTGLLIEPDDLEGLAKALDLLLSDPEKSVNFGIEGRDFVKDRFSWNEVGKKIKQSISAALNLRN